MKFIILFFIGAFIFDDQKAYVSWYNKETKQIEKIECSQNCSMCILDHEDDFKSTRCIMCQAKYYLTDNHQCEECT